MDGLSFVAPARVRALVVPLGALPAERFHGLVAQLESAAEVRLVDVTRTRTQMFNPQGFPDGRVLYDLATSLDSQESLFLHDFEPFRKTFVVIGVADTADDAQHRLMSLKKLYRSAMLHTVVVFGRNKTTLPPENERIIFNDTNPETVMCDVTRLFLDELTGYLASYQHITLRSPGTIGANENAKTIAVNNKRISSGAAIGLGDLGSSKISIKTANERRQARIKGRQLKILANLLLIAGQYNVALKEFQEALHLLKSGNDYLWIASTLEGIAVTIVMLSYLDSSYQLTPALASILHSSAQTLHTLTSPSSTPVASPRPSMAVGSVDLERFTAPELVYQIVMKALSYYEVSQTDPEDYVPDLVYCESIIRFLKFMTTMNLGSGLNNATLSHMIKGRPFKLNEENSIFDKMDILKVANRIMTVQLKKMDILSQTRIFGSLASVYGDLGFFRKRSFMLRTLFVCLIPQLRAQCEKTPCGYDLTDILNVMLSVYGISRQTEADIQSAHAPRWVQLQRSVIKLCVTICGEVQDHSTVIALKSLLLTRYTDALTDNEQINLFNEIQNLSREHGVPCTYFDPFVLRGVHLVKLSNPPTEHKKPPQTISKHTSTVLYNPYTKVETFNKGYVVQGEFAEFILEVQNPFAFAISINEIKIEGLEVFKNHYTIQPKSVSKIDILTKPLKPGEMVIESVELSICQFPPHLFKIAKFEKVEVVPKLKPQAELNETILSTFTGNLSSNIISQRVETGHTEIEVISAQPDVQIMTSLEPLMLLEGGKQQVEIKLKNNSDVPVNALDYTIWDSTMDPLMELLENREQPQIEIYELEYFLHKNSVEVISKFEQIGAHEEVLVKLMIYGKRGVNKIKLGIDYGHSRGDDQLLFTRTLDIAIPVIVHQSTDLADCAVVPLSQATPSTRSPIWDYVNKNGGIISDYVLFFIDIRNVWNKAFQIDVEHQGFKFHDSIVPMETRRITIPMKRVDLDYEALENIPLKGNRYIRNRITKHEEQFQRQSFWYREEILRHLRGRWTTGDIRGKLELRGIRLTPKMLSVLKVEKVFVSVSIDGGKSKKVGRYDTLQSGDFFTINITVQNNCKRPLRGTLRNIPTTSNYGSIERRILYNGVLQQALDNAIEPGASHTVQIGAVVVDRGEYEWGAIFDEHDTEYQHVSRVPLWIKAL